MKVLKLSVALFLLPLISVADPVDQVKALRIAERHKNDIMHGETNQVMTMAYQSLSRKRVGEVDYYIYNIGKDNGFVIVSGDDRTASVLGYSDTGSFDYAQMPENIKWWMDYYTESIEMVKEKRLSNSLSSSRPTDVIKPLLKTKWNQDDPYNLLCPESGAQRCPTGCLATAMAQVMNYHQYPSQETAPVPAYYCQNLKRVLPALPATTFDWGNMRNTYSKNSSDVSKQAVAKLMQYCGQVLEMEYSLSGSGASGMTLPDVMPRYFRYPHTMHYVNREGYSIAEWDSLLINELKNNRPILYTGYTSAMEGHAFVCDGYDGKGLYHINWGWGGVADGYFRISVLDANTAGIGAGSTSYQFSIYQSALLGVQTSGTDDFAAPEQRITISTRPALQYGYYYEREDVNASFTDIWTEITLLSQQTDNIWQEFGLALFDDEENMLQMVCTRNDYFWAGYPRDYMLNFTLDAEIQCGHYTIRPVYKHDDIWSVVAGGDRNYIDVEIDSLNATLTPIPKANFEVTSVKKEGKNLFVKLNNHDEEYNGFIFVTKISDNDNYDIISYESASIESNSTREFSFYINDQFTLDINNDVFELSVDTYRHPFYTNVKNDGAEIEKKLNILNFSDDGTTIIGDRVMCEFDVKNNGMGVYHHFIQAGICDEEGKLLNGGFRKVVDIKPGEEMHFREDFLLSEFNGKYAVCVNHFEGKDMTESSFKSDYYDVAPGAIYWTADGTLCTKLAKESFVVPEEALAINVRNAFTKEIIPNSNPNTIYMLDRTVPKSLSGHNNVNYQNKSGTITLTDGYDYYIPENIEVTSSVKYLRSFTVEDVAKWSSMVIPFDVKTVKVDDVVVNWTQSDNDMDKDYWVERIVDINGESIQIDYTSSIRANEPYLIATNNSLAGKQLVFTGGAITLSPTSLIPTSKSMRDFELWWTNHQTEKTDIFVLDTNKYVYQYETVDIQPFRVYLINEDNISTPLTIQGPDLVDGIPSVKLSGNTSPDIYTLTGVKIGVNCQTEKLPAGIYILKGKKMIVK